GGTRAPSRALRPRSTRFDRRPRAARAAGGAGRHGGARRRPACRRDRSYACEFISTRLAPASRMPPDGRLVMSAVPESFATAFRLIVHADPALVRTLAL